MAAPAAPPLAESALGALEHATAATLSKSRPLVMRRNEIAIRRTKGVSGIDLADFECASRTNW
jgi:hypothetical protein